MNEELSHKGRNVVVTGVSSGIGKAVTKTLANDGYRVFGSVRKPVDAEELQAELGAQFKPLIFDVCDAQSIRSHAQTVMEVVGDEGINAVVNNAGLALFGPMELLEDDAFDHIMQVNVAGTRNVTNAFLPHLRRAHTVHGNSRIVNISSLSGIFNTPMNGAYCVSKHAMESLGEVYRREAPLNPRFGKKILTIQRHMPAHRMRKWQNGHKKYWHMESELRFPQRLLPSWFWTFWKAEPNA